MAIFEYFFLKIFKDLKFYNHNTCIREIVDMWIEGSKVKGLRIEIGQ
jgi:hypothetical protein